MEKNKMDGACSTYGERRGIYRVLVGKPEGKRPRVEPGINGRILKWICKECDEGHGLD